MKTGSKRTGYKYFAKRDRKLRRIIYLCFEKKYGLGLDWDTISIFYVSFDNHYM